MPRLQIADETQIPHENNDTLLLADTVRINMTFELRFGQLVWVPSWGSWFVSSFATLARPMRGISNAELCFPVVYSMIDHYYSEDGNKDNFLHDDNFALEFGITICAVRKETSQNTVSRQMLSFLG